MLKCELCGETIIKTDDDVFLCEGCGCKYTKEQALKLLGKCRNSVVDDSFVIIAGVLKEYKGSAVDIVIPDGILEIGASAFSGMTSLQAVRLPKSVKHINGSAFAGCSSLRDVLLCEGIESIQNNAFEGCKNLQTVMLPNSLTYLGRSCFAGCTLLSKVHLSSNLKQIGEDAFRGCELLAELIIPDSVEQIGNVTTYSGDTTYWSIFGSYGDKCHANLTVRMPQRLDGRLVKGCKSLFDLSGSAMDTAEVYEMKMRRENWRRQHLCLACGGEIGFFSDRCKRCGKPFGTV